MNYGVHDDNGNVVEIGTRFLVSDTVKFVLSVGELGRHGWSSTLGPTPCLLHKAGCRVPLSRKANTFYLSARLGFLGETAWKMVATTSTGSAVPSPSGRELGSPESMNVVPEMSSVHEAEILDAPRKPEDPMELERHEVTHIPPMPWCLACRLGKGRDASHFRSPAVREAAQIQVDFCFLGKMQQPTTQPSLCRRTRGRRFCMQWMCRLRTLWRLRCQERTLSSSTRLGSLLASSRDLGTRNWSLGATENQLSRQLRTGSWQRSKRQVCKLEFEQNGLLATARSP